MGLRVVTLLLALMMFVVQCAPAKRSVSNPNQGRGQTQLNPDGQKSDGTPPSSEPTPFLSGIRQYEDLKSYELPPEVKQQINDPYLNPKDPQKYKLVIHKPIFTVNKDKNTMRFEFDAEVVGQTKEHLVLEGPFDPNPPPEDNVWRADLWPVDEKIAAQQRVQAQGSCIDLRICKNNVIRIFYSYNKELLITQLESTKVFVKEVVVADEEEEVMPQAAGGSSVTPEVAPAPAAPAPPQSSTKENPPPPIVSDPQPAPLPVPQPAPQPTYVEPEPQPQIDRLPPPPEGPMQVDTPPQAPAPAAPPVPQPVPQPVEPEHPFVVPPLPEDPPLPEFPHAPKPKKEEPAVPKVEPAPELKPNPVKPKPIELPAPPPPPKPPAPAPPKPAPAAPAKPAPAPTPPKKEEPVVLGKNPIAVTLPTALPPPKMDDRRSIPGLKDKIFVPTKEEDCRTSSLHKCQSIGHHENGSLHFAAEFPMQSTGILRSAQNRQAFHYLWGNDFLVNAIKKAAEELNKKYPDRQPIELNVLSKQVGGNTVPGQKSHQNGLDADVFWPGKTTGDKYAVEDKELDRTFDFMKLLVCADRSYIHLFFVDQSIKTRLCQYAKKNFPQEVSNPNSCEYRTLWSLMHWGGHVNHMHIRASCPRYERCSPTSKDPNCIYSGCQEVFVIPNANHNIGC